MCKKIQRIRKHIYMLPVCTAQIFSAGEVGNFCVGELYCYMVV